ncbi:DUF937 domain-containing protein [Lysobacter solisilvae (ex Woo and Kim 2020)]|uniref:DUF937 domain-containing protein n=1 Tax=Agrilutibacter terrestris TaxID=2865112 RepID=A0A7H0FWA1_9GAMM|nr:DUF937 domain-containing protein [Lysobacter terrestris]QNP40317.1 DUF937 domain-containing protein [Lysobacter terrestris]
MNASLTDDLLSQLQGAPLQQIGQQLGLSPGQAEGAVGAALPLLLGALGRNAAQPQGAEALLGALQRDHAGLDLGSVLGSVLGGGGQGTQILGHVFGNQQNNAAQGLGAATGLGGAQANSLLKLLAPIVLAYLARRMFAQGGSGTTAQGLGQVLGQEQQQIRQQGGLGGGLLGAVLDRDGDGDADFSDLIGLAGSVLGGRR